MMEKAFADVGLSLNIDGSQDHKIKFQGQPEGKPEGLNLLIETPFKSMRPTK